MVDVTPELPDPRSAPLGLLDQALATLVRRWATASHLVGERGVRPDGIDDATFEWWVAAHRALRERSRTERQ